MHIVPRRKRMRGGRRFQDRVTDLTQRLVPEWAQPWFEGIRETWPALDVVDEPEAVVVKADVPGMKAEDIDLAVEGDCLVLKGATQETAEQREENYYFSERRYGHFRREIPLPTDVDPERIEAHCSEGVLTIRLPKKAGARAKRIEIH